MNLVIILGAMYPFSHFKQSQNTKISLIITQYITQQ